MNITGLSHIRESIRHLNPKQVREQSDRSLNVALYAADEESYRRMEDYLLADLKPARRKTSLDLLSRGPNPDQVLKFDLAVYDESVIAPARAFIFEVDRPQRFVERVLDAHEDLGVALARQFPPFRVAYVDRIIKRVSKENAFFSLASALPDIVPSLIELPWAIAEFASDTAFLTMNQIRMAFLIAAASDRKVGYLEQKSEIATVIGGAFGWRALAKQVVGKVPFGGGLLPKAGIAYAATMLTGKSLDRFYRVGYKYSKDERQEIYHDAFKQGKTIAASLLHRLKPDLLAKEKATPYEREQAQYSEQSK